MYGIRSRCLNNFTQTCGYVLIAIPFQIAPRYLYEPKNFTGSPNSGAAFSCAISPAANLVQIQWYFETEEESGILSNNSDGVTIVHFPDAGVSILVLDSVNNSHEGLYSCAAIFTDGTMLNSSQASLVFNLQCKYSQASKVHVVKLMVLFVDNLITRNLSCDQVVYKENHHLFMTTGATEKSLHSCCKVVLVNQNLY